MTQTSKINQGVKFMLISAICLALMSAFAKVLADSLPTIEIVFFRNFFGIILISLTFFKSPLNQIGGRPLLLFFRAAIGLIAMLSFFYNIATIPLADAITYSRLSPIFTAIFAFWFLKERIGNRGWAAIAIGFIGMLFVMQPFATGFNENHLFGLLNAVCAALAFTSIRELKKHYDTRTIVLSFMTIGLVVPSIFMLISNYYIIDKEYSFIFGEFIMPQGMQWVLLLGVGITSSLGQVYLTKAYGQTRAGIVGAVGYTVILFSLVIGLILGDSLPNLLGMLGIVAIISGGILIARSKN